MKTIHTSALLILLPFGLLLAQHDPATKLNAPLVSGGEVLEFATSPDGQWVVYKADQDADDVIELYSVRATGGAVTKLNLPLEADSDVYEFRISADSRHVVYRAGPPPPSYWEMYDLYSVPIAGGAVIRLNDDETSARTSSLQITPDGTRVVFFAHRANDWHPFCHRHFSVPVQGGPLETLSPCPSLADHGASQNFEISNDSSHIVYTFANHGYWDARLVTATIDGSELYLLHRSVHHDAFAISPDGRQVAYRTGYTGGDYFHLMISPISGGADLRLEADVVLKFKFTPVPLDGSYRLVYSLSRMLKSVDVNGVERVLLTPELLYYNSDIVFDITANGTRVVFVGRYGPETDELYSVETLGGRPVKLNGPVVSGGNVESFQLSADSRHAVYRADEEIDGSFDLYSVPVAGGRRTKLSGAVRDDYRIAKDSASVVYRTWYNGLFEVPIRGGDADWLGAGVRSFEFTGDGERVIYLADPVTPGIVELYSVPRAAGDCSLASPCPSEEPGASATPWTNQIQLPDRTGRKARRPDRGR